MKEVENKKWKTRKSIDVWGKLASWIFYSVENFAYAFLADEHLKKLEVNLPQWWNAKVKVFWESLTAVFPKGIKFGYAYKTFISKAIEMKII